MTTNNPLLARGWKPSPLMVRILTAFVFLGVVIGLVLAGIYGVYLLVLILGGLAAFLFLPGRRQGLSRWAMGLAGALYVGMPFNFYLLLYTSKPNGLVWTLFTILAAVASDAAALLVGSRIGRHPFFAAISPKKTLEGAIAGVIGSVLVMLIGVSAVLGLNPLHAIALGVLVGTSAEVGDLVESQMKRLAEVKDSSHLIPGNGGVLDRLDSILFPPTRAATWWWWRSRALGP